MQEETTIVCGTQVPLTYKLHSWETRLRRRWRQETRPTERVIHTRARNRTHTDDWIFFTLSHHPVTRKSPLNFETISPQKRFES